MAVLHFERPAFCTDGRRAKKFDSRSGEFALFGPVYSLSGDSYPSDLHVDRELQSRLSPSYSGWTEQKDIHDPRVPGSFELRDFQRRAAHLESYLADRRAGPDIVLLGRSSGARLATWHASRHPVAAVIGLGYPFRNPSIGFEPERYLHLAGLTVPTLIFQGVRDEYGASNIFSDYTWSAAMRVHMLNAGHDFALTPDAWDTIARLILEFCQEVLPRP